jgi:DNA modification methylase
VCGDSRDEHLWEALLGGRKVRLVWTDPPYGVSYADKNEFLNSQDRGNRNQTPIANDHMTAQATEDLCREALVMACAHAEKGGAVYVACPPGTPLPHFIAAVAASGYTFKHSLAWVKQQFVLGRCDYHYRHETILYGWKEDGAHYFVDDHTKDSVFNVDKPHRSEEHPTMKPVELVAQMVENSSKRGEVVADPFLGSGTTLIACEQLGRVCVGFELAERYCDVICERYCRMTNKQATLEATGETFDELKARQTRGE